MTPLLKNRPIITLYPTDKTPPHWITKLLRKMFKLVPKVIEMQCLMVGEEKTNGKMCWSPGFGGISKCFRMGSTGIDFDDICFVPHESKYGHIEHLFVHSTDFSILPYWHPFMTEGTSYISATQWVNPIGEYIETKLPIVTRAKSNTGNENENENENENGYKNQPILTMPSHVLDKKSIDKYKLMPTEVVIQVPVYSSSSNRRGKGVQWNVSENACYTFMDAKTGKVIMSEKMSDEMDMTMMRLQFQKSTDVTITSHVSSSHADVDIHVNSKNTKEFRGLARIIATL